MNSKSETDHFVFEELEKRILFSADIGVLAPELPGKEIVAQELPQVQTPVLPAQLASGSGSTEQQEQSRHEVVFIDGAVDNAQALADELTQRQDSSRTLDVVVLDPAKDGIAQISAYLATQHDLSAIHIISHGADGELQLGSTQLNNSNLLGNAMAVSGWGAALVNGGDILLYGCDVAQTEAGQQFVDTISKLTGADIAASNDLTGSAALHGDWTLEYQHGQIETQVAPDAAIQVSYSGVLAIITVTSTADSGVGTLRQAILDANAASGTDTINFAIPGSGVQTISLLTKLPEITDITVLDGASQTGNAGTPGIELLGNGNGFDGLAVEGPGASGTSIKGFILSGFIDAIQIGNTTNVTIQGNYLGTTADGTAAASITNSSNGIHVNDSSNVQIGGTTAATRNIISGNSWNGIDLTATATGNTVTGNYIGTDVTGLYTVANGRDGITVSGNNNVIGGLPAGAGNLLSGNLQHGLLLKSVTNVQVLGNYIGTDVNGTAALGNGDSGISVTGTSTNNSIGGVATGARNIISGNQEDGITIDANVSNLAVIGNYIGVDLSGNAALGNASDGVRIRGNNIRVGGTSAEERNVISGNTANGVEIHSGANNSTVQGNYIGVGADGLTALGNQNGVFLASSNNVIGGTSAAGRNIISGNLNDGVRVFDGNANIVQGNYIGTDATGNVDVGNGYSGISVIGGSNVVIGGTTSGNGNLVSGNQYAGIYFSAVPTGALIAGNLVGLNAAGTAAIGNSGHGIRLDGTSGVTIGGTTPAARNVTSGNTGDGINITGSSNLIIGNYSGTNAAGSAAIANTLSGIAIDGTAAGNTIGGTSAGSGNVLSGNTDAGVWVGGNTTGTVIVGNYLGTSAAGTAAVGNKRGVSLNSTTDGIIGGTTAGARNIISGNTQNGIWSTGSNATILGNYIGLDAAGTGVVANQWGGIALHGSNDIVGDTSAGGRNYISGNLKEGIYIDGSGAIIQNNVIGLDVNGNGAGNTLSGVHVHSGSNITIGGTASGAGNEIAGNHKAGVKVEDGASGVTILRNAIHDNDALGIDLGTADGVTANDAGDTDTGANNLQNYPVVTGFQSSRTHSAVQGTLNSAANRTYTLEFYASFTPDASGYGEGPTYLGTLSVTTDASGNATFSTSLVGLLNDNTWISATATDTTTGDTSEFGLSVQATQLNNAPVGTDKTINGKEDTPYTFAAANFGFTDPDENTPDTLMSVFITSLPANGSLMLNGTAVTVNTEVLAADINKLVYTPLANAHGNNAASFTFKVRDNGGTANGGVDTDGTARTMRFNLSSVNDAPVGTAKTISIAQNSNYTFSSADFGFTDPNDSPANSLENVYITTLPTNGMLYYNGSAFTAGNYVSYDEIDQGLLVYVPASNSTNTSSFTFKVEDNGGTSNGGVDTDTTARLMTINVGAVNSAPVGTDKTLTILEDSTYTFSAADFGFTDPNDTPANNFTSVTITTLPASGTMVMNNVAVTAGMVVSKASIDAGLLRYAPAANATATVSFTFQVSDDGSSANGGVTTDPTARTMTIAITAVNDAPDASGVHNYITREDTPYTFAAADFGFTDPNDSPANNFLEVLISSLPANGTLSNSGIALTAGAVISITDIDAGKLVYTPPANANGSGLASFTFRVRDDGGTANGGIDTDPVARTMSLHMTTVNDAPQGASNTVNTAENTAYTFAAGDFGFTDPNDSPADNFLAVIIDAIPAGGVLTNGGVLIMANTVISKTDIDAGKLVYTPAANVSGAGAASFTFRVQDDGGTANTGVDTDTTARTMTIDVAAVATAPVITPSAGSTNYTPAAGAAVVAIDAGITVSDADSATLAYGHVSIAGNFKPGEDALLFAADSASMGNISGSYNAATGILSLTSAGASATTAQWQAALRAVSYANSALTPSTAVRTIEISLDDGGLTTTVTRALHLNTLVAGDIAVLGFDSVARNDIDGDGIQDGRWSIVALRDLKAGMVINFTDAGIDQNGNFINAGGKDGHLTWTLTADVAAGTILSMDTSTGRNFADLNGSAAGKGGLSDYGTLTGTLGGVNTTGTVFNGVGDQLIVYQGNAGLAAGATFLYALSTSRNTDGIGQWQQTGTATLSNDSYLPPGLVNGVTAVALTTNTGNSSGTGIANSGSPNYGFSSMMYAGTLRSGIKAEILAALADASNWNGSNSTGFDFSVGAGHEYSSNFTVVQPKLVAGDIAVLGFDTNNYGDIDGDGAGDGHWAIVALTTLKAGTVIQFTDAGINATRDGFISNPGLDSHLTWTLTSDVAAGTILTMDTSTGINFADLNGAMAGKGGLSDYGTVSGRLGGTRTAGSPVPITGDQLIIYQGDTGVVTGSTFIYAFTNSRVATNDGTGAWQSTGAATGESQSYIPPGLVDGYTAVALTTNTGDSQGTGVANSGSANYGFTKMRYAGDSLSEGTKEQILTAMADATHWQGGSSNGYDYSVGPGKEYSRNFVIHTVALTTSAGDKQFRAGSIWSSVDAALDLSSNNNDTIASATVSIGSGFNATQDFLNSSIDAATMGNISYAYDYAAGVLTLTSAGNTATLAQWQAALRSVGYGNSSTTPDLTDRAITFSVVTVAGDTVSAGKTVHIFNPQPPVLASTPATTTYTEGQAPVAVDTSIVVTEPDGYPIHSADIHITSGFQAGQDVLAFNNNDAALYGNIGVLYDANNGHLLLLSQGDTATAAQWQAALRAITYSNSSVTPDTASRTLTFQIADAYNSSNATAQTVNVVAVNSAPVLTPTAGATAYTENGAGVVVDAGITLTDADNGTLASALAVITGNFTAGDFLKFTNDGSTMGNITQVYDIGPGVARLVSAGGTATLAQWQAALRAVTYFSISDNPGTSRVVSFTANDGMSDSAVVTRSIAITQVNDAPVGTDHTVNVVETVPYTFVAGDFGFTDPADGGANQLLAVIITTLPSTGTLLLDGLQVHAGDAVSKLDIDAGKLVYQYTLLVRSPFQSLPVLPGFAGNSSFTFQVRDDGGTANGGVDTDTSARTMTLAVSSINRAPVGASGTVTTLENTPYTFTVADFGFRDSDDPHANTLESVVFTTLPSSGTLTYYGKTFAAGNYVNVSDLEAGALVYTPVTNANGAAAASFTFQVRDNGGTANGGANTDATPRLMTVAVTSVNNAPSGADHTLALMDNKAYAFLASDFGFSDSGDTPANDFVAVILTSVPASGSLTLNGVLLKAGSVVARADIDAGRLIFTPLAYSTGRAVLEFGFRVQDDGGVLNGGADTDGSTRFMRLGIASALADGGSSTVVLLPSAPVSPGALADSNANATERDSESTASRAAASAAASSAASSAAAAANPATRVDIAITAGSRQLAIEIDASAIRANVVRYMGEHNENFAASIEAWLPKATSAPESGSAFKANLVVQAPVDRRNALLTLQKNSSSGSDSSIGAIMPATRSSEESKQEFSPMRTAAHRIETAIAVSALGTIWVVARKAALVASLLSTVPAWLRLDPLPILGGDEEDGEEELEESEEQDQRDSVEHLFSIEGKSQEQPKEARPQ